MVCTQQLFHVFDLTGTNAAAAGIPPLKRRVKDRPRTDKYIIWKDFA